MKHRWLRRTLILLAALGLCFGMVWYSREKPQTKTESLTLWYTKADCSPTAMEGLLARYLKETGRQIKATAYEDEVSLGEALEKAMPDLLFCSHIRAAQLDGRGDLSALSSALPIPDAFLEMRPAVGSVFFPVGSRLPVLLANTALTEDRFDNLEAMLDAAGEDRFLVCDRRSELLYTLAAAKGIQLTGIGETDMQDQQIAALYNQLALAVFRGSLVFRENPAEYVRQGMMPAAVVPSTVLAEQMGENLEVRRLPLPKDAQMRYPAELMGFVFFNGADMGRAESFFRWLWNGKREEAALKAGLVPTMSADSAGSENGSDHFLCSLGESGTLFWPDADEPFIRNRNACEDWLARTLDLLA